MLQMAWWTIQVREIVGLAQSAASALWNLTIFDRASRTYLYNLANQDEVRESGGIPVLVWLARDGADEQTLIAVGALRSLTHRNPANQDAVRECGGVPVLVGLARDGTEAQKDYAAAALWNITANNPANKDAVRECGGVPVLVGLARDGTGAQKDNATGALQTLTV